MGISMMNLGILMMSNIIRYRRKTDSVNKTVKPVTTEWKNARMVRTHSIKVASHEIITMSSNIDVVKVNIVGETGSGKTALASTLAHLLHKESSIPYSIRLLTRDHLLNIKKFVATLQATNYILIFDDISFLSATASANKIKQIEQTFTELRHLPGGLDIKIIAIFNFHYTKSISPYLRQSNAHFYTTIGSSDKTSIIDIVGKGYIRKIKLFIKMRNQAIATSKFVTPLGNKGKKFVYDYQKPFVPALFYNGNSARIIVFPLRTWISPFCTICANAKPQTESNMSSIVDFDKSITSKFHIGITKQAVRLKLYINGVSTYSDNVKRAMIFIDKFLENNSISLEDLANFYKLNNNAVRLRIDPALFEHHETPDKDATVTT